MPPGTGLIGEGQTCQFGNDGLQRGLAVAEKSGIEVHLADRSVFEEVIGQSGGVGKEIADEYRTNRVGEGLVVSLPNFYLREGGKVLGERIEQVEPRFFVERHERRANDRLGHRVDAKNGRGVERLLAGHVTDAAVVKMDDFATAGEERSDAREIARLDICLHLRLDAGEATAIEALRFGSGDLCHWRGVAIASYHAHRRRGGLGEGEKVPLGKAIARVARRWRQI